MPDVMSALSVFRIAIGMEEIGKDFYQALAAGCSDANVRAFCLEAAQEEHGHSRVFRELHDGWAGRSGSTGMHPESVRAVAALAKQRIQPDPAIVRKVALGGSLSDALSMAIEMERASVSFYQRIVASLPGAAQVIQGIVDEEVQHLSQMLSLAALLPRAATAAAGHRARPHDRRGGRAPRCGSA